jgi:hypothetical protein
MEEPSKHRYSPDATDDVIIRSQCTIMFNPRALVFVPGRSQATARMPRVWNGFRQPIESKLNASMRWTLSL